jgi:glutamate racemase
VSDNPIGIFDSGIGGLTVANAVSVLLPHEKLIYFGDTAHLPYGDKSSKAIRNYSKSIFEFLLNKNCKCIIIACNSASASIGNAYTKWIPPQFPVINVIDPVIGSVVENPEKTIGLIGTKRTVASAIFPKKLKESLQHNKKIKSLATPLLAPMIEEGFFNNNISKTIIKAYLESPRLKGIKSLILACTHYPLIENEIADATNNKIKIYNSAQIVAQKTKEVLIENNAIHNLERNPEHEFYISDYTHAFENAAKRFFGKKIKLKEFDLWKQ